MHFFKGDFKVYFCRCKYYFTQMYIYNLLKRFNGSDMLFEFSQMKNVLPSLY